MMPDQGLILEFGVWSGKTINMIADNVGQSRQVHGFDSFEGLPEDWFGQFTKGRFRLKAKPLKSVQTCNFMSVGSTRRFLISSPSTERISHSFTLTATCTHRPRQSSICLVSVSFRVVSFYSTSTSTILAGESMSTGPFRNWCRSDRLSTAGSLTTALSGMQRCRSLIERRHHSPTKAV